MVLALSSCATLERDDLSSYVEQLHSDAAEGALLAGQAAARRAPVVFVWLHSAELEHHVGELRDHLDGEMPSRGLTGQVHIAKVLSEEVSHELGRLRSSLAWYGGIGAMAAIGALEWPLAAVVVTGHLISENSRSPGVSGAAEGAQSAAG
jgi:hypothetical protein